LRRVFICEARFILITNCRSASHPRAGIQRLDRPLFSTDDIDRKGIAHPASAIGLVYHFGLSVLGFVFLPCFAYDLLTRGRIHRAYTSALTLFVVIAMSSAPSWAPWLDFSRAVQHLLG
jgi:hypothetical protein